MSASLSEVGHERSQFIWNGRLTIVYSAYFAGKINAPFNIILVHTQHANNRDSGNNHLCPPPILSSTNDERRHFWKPPHRRVQLNNGGANQTVSTRHVVSTRKVQIQLKFTGKWYRRDAVQFFLTLFVFPLCVASGWGRPKEKARFPIFARNIVRNISEVHIIINSLILCPLFASK